jgi:drug/metabolite transporter, DME family
MAVGAAAYQPFFFGAVDRSGVALSTLVAVGAGPIFTGILGWVILKQRPNSLWIGATGLAIFGLLVLNEKITWPGVIGMILVLVALLLQGKALGNKPTQDPAPQPVL